ncbi:MAG: 5-methyltetrahydropteroyltriglutamate--homocysteine methyltransferase [Actinomycetota bacterium]|nr:5-methyltetrahydropteroyltriglutamate--homocysteine methyltransferase [Actinomycetota bacterium]
MPEACLREEFQIQTTVVGSYPKPPDEGRPFVLRKTLHALDRGDAGPQDVQKAVEDLTREVIAEQEAAGIDIISDGQAGWPDLLRPFAETIAGFEIGGLLRWFDNNTYYRRPVCVDDVDWRGPSSVHGFRFARSVASHPVKAVIPGPVTFARLSVDEHYRDHQKFVLALARVLAQEAFELEAAGAEYIQIDEPALLGAPEDADLARQALDIVTSNLSSAEVTLATYFGDASKLGVGIFDLPAQVVAFDLVSGPNNLDLIKKTPPGIKIQAGVMDARNTKLEAVEDIARVVAEITSAVDDADVRLSPSAGLEFLPREKARAKLNRLGEAAQRVRV